MADVPTVIEGCLWAGLIIAAWCLARRLIARSEETDR